MGSPWGARVTLSVDSTPTFARRLKQARLHTGLSQKELGIRAGLDPHVASPRINQYERGKHEPKLETAERLAQALGIPAALLYGAWIALVRAPVTGYLQACLEGGIFANMGVLVGWTFAIAAGSVRASTTWSAPGSLALTASVELRRAKRPRHATPNSPISRFANPLCSLFSDSVLSGPKTKIGCWPANALFTKSPPSPVNPDNMRIRSATPLLASKTA